MDLKDNYKEKILNRLLDLFENRKVFKTLDFSKNNIYIDYKDKLLAYYHKEKYRYLPYFSNELDILTRNKLIFIKYDQDEEIERIYLNLNNIDSCYEFVSRTNKVKLYNELILLVNKYLSNSTNKVIKSYLNDCLITLNNRVSYADKFKNSEDLILILKGIKGIIENKNEILIRNFSVKIFSDSKYFENNISARAIKINTNFVPDTLYVVLTASLFAGDAKAGSGTKVGSVVIKVPRFQLNGSQEISMTMTGASNTAFEGSALAVEEDGCNGKAYYAEILEILFNARWYDNVRSIQIEDSDVTVKAGAVNMGLDVYAIYANALPKKISNDIISAGEGSVEVRERSKLVFSKVGDTGSLSIDSSTGNITGTATQGTYTFRVAAMKGETPLGLDATMLLTVTA